MRQARVLTIILNWRTADMTLRSLAAARAAMVEVTGEIIVVDNDSGDGSFETITAHVAEQGWSDVRVIQSGRNGGFGAGNNVGIRAGLSDGSAPDFVYLLNSDAFPEAGTITALRDHLLATPAAGFAGSLIRGTDGVTHLATFRFPSIRSELEGAARFGPLSRMLRDHAVPLPTPDTTQRVDWLAGASLMMRHSVLDEIGVFDETFFLYFEETDLCLRAARAGFETHFVRDSVVEHIGSVSTGMKDWDAVPDYWFASRQYYFAKNNGAAAAVLATCAHLAGFAFANLRAGLTGKARPFPKGYARGLLRHQIAQLRGAGVAPNTGAKINRSMV